MRPHEIFAVMPPERAAAIFAYLHEEEKPLYKATIDTLAKQRKLRPVFIERKPRQERFAWIREALGRKANESVSAHLLQIWLVGKHSGLLCDFLDGLGIPHDENGTVETLPDAPPKEDLARTIDTLLEKHDAADVAIYLHAFQATHDEGGWDTLQELLDSDARLKMGGESRESA